MENMQKHETLNEVLNDLVKINNDRIAGYQKAISDAHDLDIDLKALFESMITESAQYKEELVAQIKTNGGMVEDDTTTSGKIYRAWMEIKSTFTSTDRHAILDSCEFGEDAAQRAYESALQADGVHDTEVRHLIAGQQASLKKSHDMIKKQRDAHKLLQK